MTIQLYKQPNLLNFSKNPIHFGFNISPFSDVNVVARQRIYLTVLFSFDLENTQYEEVWTGAIGPDKDGFCVVDIASILDAKLKFYTPNTSLLKFHKCKEQNGIFKIRYYLADNNAMLTAESTSDAYYVYKGGVAKEDFDNDATYLNTTIFDNRRPLHFYDAKERVRNNEPKWLFFIYKKAAGWQASELSVNINFYQGAYNSDYGALVQSFLPIEYQVYCFPVDVNALLLPDNVPSSEELDKWYVIIQDENLFFF